MADYIIKGETLSGIADAIRSKTGQSRNFRTSKMAEEINKIPLNGEIVEPILQNKTITENGTYTAESGYDGFNEVIVEVSSGSGGDGGDGGAISAPELCDISLSIWGDGFGSIAISHVVYMTFVDGQYKTKHVTVMGDDVTSLEEDLVEVVQGSSRWEYWHNFTISAVVGSYIYLFDEHITASSNITLSDNLSDELIMSMGQTAMSHRIMITNSSPASITVGN